MTIAIIDYGLGNLLSVERAFEHLGVPVSVTSDPEEVGAGSAVVLPGVGAFDAGMQRLQALGLDRAVHAAAGEGRPVLGICLGMQLLFETSEELGHHTGLGILGGHVVAIPPERDGGGPRFVPHIGWSALESHSDSRWRTSVLGDLARGTSMYFLHSFRCVPSADVTAATIDHDGAEVCAVVVAGAIQGCQFHPEKSGPAGLAVLRRFAEFAGHAGIADQEA
jgi:glutamine amidotransferase